MLLLISSARVNGKFHVKFLRVFSIYMIYDPTVESTSLIVHINNESVLLGSMSNFNQVWPHFEACLE